jgi:hypothetical protein
MRSTTLPLYKNWYATATPEQIEFVDQVYVICEENYEKGGDRIVECYGPEEIIEDFKTITEVREHCNLMVEQELNARWGEDNDPELSRGKF